MRDLGGALLAVSAEPPEVTREAQAALATPYPFPVLPDPTLSVVDRYGLIDPQETDAVGRRLSRPALFLLDRAGVVRYAHVGEHARDRPAVAAILLALETMP